MHVIIQVKGWWGTPKGFKERELDITTSYFGVNTWMAKTGRELEGGMPVQGDGAWTSTGPSQCEWGRHKAVSTWYRDCVTCREKYRSFLRPFLNCCLWRAMLTLIGMSKPRRGPSVVHSPRLVLEASRELSSFALGPGMGHDFLSFSNFQHPVGSREVVVGGGRLFPST